MATHNEPLPVNVHDSPQLECEGTLCAVHRLPVLLPVVGAAVRRLPAVAAAQRSRWQGWARANGRGAQRAQRQQVAMAAQRWWQRRQQ